MLVPVPVAITAFRFSYAAHGADRVLLREGKVKTIVPRDRWVLYPLEIIGFTESKPMVALNIPAIAIDGLISLPTSWPMDWHPQALSFQAWRVVSYPFYCLPAWWFVGLSLDGFVSRRRLNWSSIVIGAILSALCSTAVIGMWFGISEKERGGEIWPILGFALWALLFAVLPLAGWRQRRRNAARYPEG